MTHGELVSVQGVGAVEPEGTDFPVESASNGWVNPQLIPQVYADLFLPPEIDRRSNPYGDPDKVADIVTAAIADIAVRGGKDEYARAPVPISADLSVLQETLNRLPMTPLAFVNDVYKKTAAQLYWNRFRDGSIQSFREEHRMGRSDIVPIDLVLPEGLDATDFDPLYGAVALQAKIKQESIKMTLGTAVTACEIMIEGYVTSTARIGDKSCNSKFAFFGGPFSAARSFVDSHDVIIDFGRTQPYSKIGRIDGSSMVTKLSGENNGKLTIIGDSACIKSTGSNIQFVRSL